jgi:cellulose synthase/poly-beta-1,6-N-acetylglucosamine synthase-like glycosyltransferase
MLSVVSWFCLVYVACINLGYLALNVVSFVVLGRYMRRHPDEEYQPGSDFEPPVSLLVPAYNEATTVVASVRSLLQLRWRRRARSATRGACRARGSHVQQTLAAHTVGLDSKGGSSSS